VNAPDNNDRSKSAMEVEDQITPVRTVSFVDEMDKSYLDYMMSTVKSRALPDVRDGMKPVHRRILFAMAESGYTADRKHVKSAKVVGDVMGQYHPHGDSSIYDALVRMGQPWSLRYPLIDPQGNFGSIDNDPPAAMRYTESRLERLAGHMVADLDEGVVDFNPNYDASAKEPKVLPARFPNLLVNGQIGIAVGMATNIPPHHLGETIDACLLRLDNAAVTLDEILQVLPGPDMPTFGVIHGRAGIRQAYATGRGAIRVSGTASIEEMKGGRHRIVVTQLPYLVVKSNFVEELAQLVEDKKIEGITDIRDESSDKVGIRVAIDLRKDVDSAVVLNRLREKTEFVTNFNVNLTCLDSRGRPRQMGVLQILGEFVDFRREVVRRRTLHRLEKARADLHRQIGLYAATLRMDEVVRTIRSSHDSEVARAALLEMEFATDGGFAQLLSEVDPDIAYGDTFRLSDIQVRSILDMRLARLTGLERDKIADRARELSGEIRGGLDILNNRPLLDGIVRLELEEIKAAFPDERRTVIEDSVLDALSDEDLVELKDIVVTVTAGGYVKRTDLAAYRLGRQKAGEEIDEDVATTTIVCTTKTPLLFFTSRGLAHAEKAHKLPEAAANARGRALVNFLDMKPEETVEAVVALPDDKAALEALSLVFVTDFGTVRRNDASDFAKVNKGGKLAIKLDDENGEPLGRLVSVQLVSPEDDIALASRDGMCCRFNVGDLRVMKSRDSVGVAGISLGRKDKVVAVSILRHFEATGTEREAYLAGGSTKEKDPGTGEMVAFELSSERMLAMQDAEQMVLTVSETGFAKRTSSHAYRITARGGQGVEAAKLADRTGDLVALMPVDEKDVLILTTDTGKSIRATAADAPIMARGTQGTRVFALEGKQQIVSVLRVSSDPAGK
jgi:DNA gyrase subunit A